MRGTSSGQRMELTQNARGERATHRVLTEHRRQARQSPCPTSAPAPHQPPALAAQSVGRRGLTAPFLESCPWLAGPISSGKAQAAAPCPPPGAAPASSGSHRAPRLVFWHKFMLCTSRSRSGRGRTPPETTSLLSPLLPHDQFSLQEKVNKNK